jgi:hypothetical protein
MSYATVRAVQRGTEFEKLAEDTLSLLTTTPPEELTKEQLVQLIEEVIGNIDDTQKRMRYE